MPCLFHAVISCLKISQSARPSLSYPLCPLLKPVPTDSLHRCARTQETCPVSPGKAASHWLQRELRCHQPQSNFRGRWERGGKTMMLMLGCVTLAGCLPSPLGEAGGPQLCAHGLTRYTTQCPTDIFPGRESEYEMIVLFTSYLLTLSVSGAARSSDGAAAC